MAVVVTKQMRRTGRYLTLVAAWGVTLPLTAAVLPEDRFDALLHSYQGGGMDIHGPSLMIRKLLGNSAAVSANYYVDSISAASIDVITSASPYKQERNEYSVGVEYLRDKSTLSFNYTDSEENDYVAQTYSVAVSQDFFGDLTTLSMGYARGKDEVMRVTTLAGNKQLDSNFGTRSIDRHNFSLGLAQVLTKKLVAGMNYDLITDKGFLNNPYRQVRFADGSRAFENYPNTRSSHALALQLKYHLPYRAALSGKYRYFNDTWDIEAHTFELGYTHPVKDRWLVDLRYRLYEQSRASFYADVFSGPEAQTFMARDKELSTYNNRTLGVTLSYDLGQLGWRYIDKGSLNLAFDHMVFDYEDFRDASVTGVPIGEEPLYHFSSDVMQFYISVWY